MPARRAATEGARTAERRPGRPAAATARRNVRSGGPLSLDSPGRETRPGGPHLPKKALWTVTADSLPLLSVTTAFRETARPFSGPRTVIFPATTGAGSH